MEYYHLEEPFQLEGGGTLARLTIAYHTWGTLNAGGSNVIWICHALTASSDAADWWSGLVGPGKVFDPELHFIVCANILGSPYGSTSPLSTDPATGAPYYRAFPQLTVRDLVAAHRLLFSHLGIPSIRLLLGGSLGGYQVLEWAATAPEEVDQMFLIATSARESPWGIAAHTAQRMAIEADPTWGLMTPAGGREGLKAARAMGMLLYRSYENYALRQADAPGARKDFRAESYIRYQGEKLAGRFNAYSYHLLTRTMDSHHLGRDRNPAHATAEVLRLMEQRTLLISIREDLLCPAAEAEEMAAALPNCTHHTISSVSGHDGFLTESEAIAALLRVWTF